MVRFGLRALYGLGKGRRYALGERPSGVQSQAGHCDEGNVPIFAGSRTSCSLCRLLQRGVVKNKFLTIGIDLFIGDCNAFP